MAPSGVCFYDTCISQKNSASLLTSNTLVYNTGMSANISFFKNNFLTLAVWPTQRKMPFSKHVLLRQAHSELYIKKTKE